MANLLVSMLDRVGAKVDSFGDSTGALRGAGRVKREVSVQREPGSARVPRAGFGVPPKRTSCGIQTGLSAASVPYPREVRRGGTPRPARETRAFPGVRGVSAM
jgi:hypothetical protein